jgi:hypothetical protein
LTVGLLIGCQNTSPLSQGGDSTLNGGLSQTPTTGLEGYIYKRPITPACTENIPCTAPFLGSFAVWQEGKRMAQFQTDEKGHFRVALSPGVYSVTVANPTGTAFLRPDQPSVTVGKDGMTQVVLTFDTGLR